MEGDYEQYGCWIDYNIDDHIYFVVRQIDKNGFQHWSRQMFLGEQWESMEDDLKSLACSMVNDDAEARAER